LTTLCPPPIGERDDGKPVTSRRSAGELIDGRLQQAGVTTVQIAEAGTARTVEGTMPNGTAQLKEERQGERRGTGLRLRPLLVGGCA
jgi:hypothetical protein